MKIAVSQLRRIIREETRRVLREGRYDAVTDPIKVHNELQRRLLAHMERKRGR